jgi:hypothetical protein
LRIVFGLNRSVRGDAAMTASAPRAVRASQDRTEIARFLHALEDDDEGVVGIARRQIGRRDARDRDETLGPFAERDWRRPPGWSAAP